MGVKRGLISPEQGTFVSVRPCDDECKGKTYLGIYIGSIPLSLWVGYNSKEGELTINAGMHNPAIWVPALKRVVMGCESWWGKIESPEDLKEITDSDIENCWYVKALKARLAEEMDEKKADDLVNERRAAGVDVMDGERNKGKPEQKEP